MCTGRFAADPDYGVYTGHPMDPRSPADEHGLLSKQTLGDLTVSVEYDLGAFGSPSIVGAWFSGGFVEVEEFSPARVARWHEAICRELEKASEGDEAEELDRIEELADAPRHSQGAQA